MQNFTYNGHDYSHNVVVGDSVVETIITDLTSCYIFNVKTRQGRFSDVSLAQQTVSRQKFNHNILELFQTLYKQFDTDEQEELKVMKSFIEKEEQTFNDAHQSKFQQMLEQASSLRPGPPASPSAYTSSRSHSPNLFPAPLPSHYAPPDHPPPGWSGPSSPYASASPVNQMREMQQMQFDNRMQTEMQRMRFDNEMQQMQFNQMLNLETQAQLDRNMVQNMELELELDAMGFPVYPAPLFPF